MTCEDCQKTCFELLDGALSPEEERKIRKHVETCPACAEFLKKEQRRMRDWPRFLHAAAERTEAQMPSDTAARVLGAKGGGAGLMAWWRRFSGRRGVAASLLMLAAPFLAFGGVVAVAWLALSSGPGVDGESGSADASAAEVATSSVQTAAVASAETEADGNEEDAPPNVAETSGAVGADMPPLAENLNGEQEREPEMKITNIIYSGAAAIALTTASMGANTFTGGAGSDWNTPANWSSGTVPLAGEAVVIDADAMLTNATPALASLTVNTGMTLTFDGWGTVLTAADVAIAGTVTHLPNTATETNSLGVWVPNARVNIECGSLTVSAGGKIDVNGKGFKGGPAGGVLVPGYGPGGGYSKSNVGSGAGHGSVGGNGGFNIYGAGAPGGVAYGYYLEPELPGSGGGGGQLNTSAGSAGGGAVRISASGSVVVDGVVSADSPAAGNNCAGGGSGGSVWIACQTISGAGVVHAVGGNGNIANGTSGGGGAGGRIAIDYDAAAQAAVPVPALAFSAQAGSADAAGFVGDIGSLHFPDERFLISNGNAIVHSGSWMSPGFGELKLDSLTLENVWVRFDGAGFVLEVTNAITLSGTGHRDLNRLEVVTGDISCGSLTASGGVVGIRDGGDIAVGGSTMLQGGALLALDSAETKAASFVGTGAVSLAGGATARIRAAAVNMPSADYSALFDVGGAFSIESGSWVYTHSHPTNGAAPLFRAGSLSIAAGGGIDASEKGFSYRLGGNGYGPGGGLGSRSGGGGGGHGGYGGLKSGAFGMANGSHTAPVLPGSAGGCGNGATTFGGHGGGVIRIQVVGAAVINGSLLANGMSPTSYPAGGGAGGSVFVTCAILQGGGVVSACGGNGFAAGGGGGGGRIAVIYNPALQSAEPLPEVLFLATPGSRADTTLPTLVQVGDVGTIYFPDSQFLTRRAGTDVAMKYGGEWLAPGLGDSLQYNSLALSNIFMRIPHEGFTMDVAGAISLNGTGHSLMHRLELTNGVVISGGDISMSKATLRMLRGTADHAAVQCGGNLYATNGSLVYMESMAPVGSGTPHGATFEVAGQMEVSGASWVYPQSHATLGGAVVFRAQRINVGLGAGFDATGFGYAGGKTRTSNGVGPGGGYYAKGGGGYGGGGGGRTATAGNTYGLAHAPLEPGSGGGYDTGGAGGGVVWLEAAGDININGSIYATGGGGGYLAGGGSGGGILLACRSLTGTGTVQCDGGSTASAGGGGGGRIAVWENVIQPYSDYLLKDARETSVAEEFGGTFSSAPGNGVSTVLPLAEAGTVKFYAKNPTATTIVVR